MATLMGVVSKVIGEVFAVAADGSRRPLEQGDKVFVGEQLVTGANGAVALKVAGGGEITLGRDSSLPLTSQMLAAAHQSEQGDQSVAQQQPATPTKQDVTDVKALQAAIAAGADPTQQAEATAAGPTAAGAANNKPGGGHSFVLLTEVGGHIDPNIGFPTGPIGSGPLPLREFDGVPQPRVEAVTPPPEVLPPDGQPSAGPNGPGLANVFEAGLPGGIPDGAGEGATFSGNLGYNFGSDGVGSFTWGTSGLPNLTSGGVAITYSVSPDGHVLTGSANGTPVFTVTLTNISTGAFEVTLLQPVDHPVKGSEDTLNFDIPYVITDGNGTSANGTVNVGIVDDAPQASLSGNLGVDVLLQTHDANTAGAAFDTSTADYSSAFKVTANYGGDGAGSTELSYSLNLLGGNGANSGLTSGGATIYLYSVGGAIVASTSASAAGITGENTVFSLSVNGNTGVVTLTQYSAIDHPLPGSESGYASQTISLDSGLVQLQGNLTVTDRDGDSITSSSSLDLGGRVSFTDDGPSISVGSTEGLHLTVDESNLGQDATSSVAASDLFNSQYGADGAGSIVYKVSATDNTDSGLKDTATGDKIFLFNTATGVEGRVGGVNGEVAFRVTLGEDGKITLDQVRALVHPDAADANDPLSLGEGKISLTATVTDADGDHQSASLDLGSKLTFLDDGPSISVGSTEGLHLTVDETNLGQDATSSVAASDLFNSQYGADGAGSIVYKVSATDNTDSGLKDTATGDKIFLFNTATGVEGRVGGVNGEVAFRVTLGEDGKITLDQVRALVHPDAADANDPLNLGEGKISLTATVTDADGDHQSASLDLGSKLTFLDDGPSISVGSTEGLHLTVDETQLGVPATSDSVADLFNGQYGADGAGSITYKLEAADNTDSGLKDTATGSRIFLYNTANGVEGRLEGTSTVAFRVSIDGDGKVTLEQLRALAHSDPNDPNDSLSLAGKIDLSATITDKDGDSATAHIDLGGKLSFLDDGPSIEPCKDADIRLTVDETHLGVGDTSSTSVADLFTTHFGADGAGSITYKVGTSDGTDSGLKDTATGEKIFLYNTANGVEGRVGTGSDVAFRVTLDADGKVTLDQLRAVVHPNASDANDGVSLDANTITLTATITDGDGDHQSASLDLGGKLTFLDDGPSIEACKDTDIKLTVDETQLGQPDTSSVNVADLFNAHYGADGAGSIEYKLSAADNSDSGLKDIATGSRIFLYNTANGVEGRLEGSSTVAFRVSIDGDGKVTLEQLRAMVHPDANNANDDLHLAGQVSLTATITDGDGDHASASIDLGSKLTFLDDGPSIAPSTIYDISLEVDESNLGSDARVESSLVSLLFESHFGADGPGSITYKVSTADGTDSGLRETASGDRIFLYNENGTVVGRVEHSNAIAFVVSEDNGALMLDQRLALVHGNPDDSDEPLRLDTGKITLTATVTDGDGDHASAYVDLGSKMVFYDDGPSIEPCTTADIKLTVDETQLGVGASASASDVSGLFNSHFGNDGAGGITYKLSAATDGMDSGLKDTATGGKILLFTTDNGVEGRVEGTNVVAFSVTLHNGAITLDQQRALVHPITTDSNDPLSIGSDKITLTATITDGDGDHASAQIDLGGKLIFLDDGPSIQPCTDADISLVVDETTLGSAARVEASLVSQLFTTSFGADGAGSVTYKVSVALDGTDSGLRASENGARILLFNDGNGVVGKVEGSNTIAFVVRPDGGALTLEQRVAFIHPDGHSDDETLSIATGKISLTATVTDGDGDHQSATVDLGSKLIFHDDGPSIVANQANGPALVVDESNLNANASASITSLFTSHYGADGAGSLVYKVVAGTEGGDSGLRVTNGDKIYLFNEAGGVVGRVGGPGGAIAFTVTVNNGTVTLDQQMALKHPDGGDPDDALNIASGKISLTATITDGDGDSHSASVELGSQLTFHDDGPSIAVNTQGSLALTVDESNLGSDASANVASLFTSSYGADGAGSLVYSVAAVSNGSDSGLSVTNGDKIYLFNENGGVVGRVGGSGGAIAFTVTVNNGSITLDQQMALKHPITTDANDALSIAGGKINLVATITDGDGDSQSARIDLGNKLTFLDDGPSISVDTSHVPTLTVDESNLSVDASANFSTAFNASTGADGGNTAYSLTATTGTQSGLQTTDGQNIVLVKVSDTQVEGRVGGTGGALAFKVTLDSGTGVVKLDQQLALKHPNASDPNDALSLANGKIGLTATVTDGDGDSKAIGIDLGSKLTFLDDGPTAVDDNPRCLVQQAPPAVNLTLVVDVSGSMQGDKLANAKAALVNLVQQYAAMGIAIHVSLLTFASSAKDLGDFNFNGTSDAQYTSLVNKINGLQTEDNTNYQVALNLAKANVTSDITASGHDPAAINRVYFISDGQPNEGSTSTAITQWKAFLANPDGDNNDATNHVDAYAVGLGTSITNADLVGIDGKGTPIIVTQPGDLTATLQNLVTIDSVSGNLLANDVPVSADGTVRITQVEFGGEKFAVDASGVMTNVNPNATSATGSYNTSTGLLTIQTSSGTLTLYLKDVAGHQAGDYTYASKAGVAFPESGQISEVFKYTIVDGDGDTASANLNICLKYGQPILVVGSNAGDVDGSSVLHTVPSPLDADKAGQINGSGGNDVLIGDAGGVSVYTQPGKNYNISLIVDTSGSMGDASGTAGLTRMALAKNALTNLINAIKGHDGVINISLVSFSDSSHVTTYNGLTTANVAALIAAIGKLSADGATNYDDAMKSATAWFNTQVATNHADAAHNYVNLAFFLTDGNPTVYNGNSGSGNSTSYNDMNVAITSGNDMLHHAGTLVGDNSVAVNAIGIGNGINSDYLRYFDNTNTTGTVVTNVDGTNLSNTVGQPQIINTAEQLQAALQEGFSTSTPVTVGNDHLVGGAGNDILFGDVINTDALAWAGHAAGSHNGQGYQALVDYLTATNGSAPTVAQVTNYIVQHADQLNVAGDMRGGNDILEGGAGNDLMFGQGGNDKLIGGPGDDIMYGGTGADEFIWKAGDTGHDVIKDFSIAEGDSLNLADLLQGALPNADSLSHYLTFSVNSGTTSIGVSPTSGGTTTQTIDLANVDLAAKYAGHAGNGVLSAGDTHTVLNGLLGDHAIKTDTV
ncbi:retention module-containing protein [Pseudomonas nitroreducens]|uniref:retention module-containing protein n=1 Tax=Pseudomonas nitroreducens TaxID=46680 RepID=UPI00209DB304|nr:retention module-containing protein [Pseudomonas nitroreducens]MCP1622346.1 T1SS-143 domain-containing protein [Pseudomonas nitroreducens]